MKTTLTNHGAAVPMPSVRADVRHVTDWPCRRCAAKNLQQTDIGGGVFEDYRYRCNACGFTWTEEGSDT